MALGPEAPAFKPEPQAAGGIQMLRNRLLTASSGEPGSSHARPRPTSNYPLPSRSCGAHPVKG